MAKSNIFTARTEFASALAQICSERGLETKVVLATIESAILAAYRKDYGLDEGFLYDVKVDPNDGSAKIYKYPRISEAKTIEGAQPGVDYDEKKQEEVTPPGFGRIASQTAKQVILQKIREAEKEAIVSEYQDRVGSLVSGMILRRDGKFIIVDIGRGQAVMPPEEQVYGENYSLNKRFTFYIKDIRETTKGKQIIVSRSSGDFIKELFKREVPEVSSGAVAIKNVAREAGGRTKIAVMSTQSGVDPVGSCVGQKGVRVQTVIDEINGEKVDIIQYSDDPVKFLKASLSPAENLEIQINEKDKAAVVIVPEDQLSLAIGREGQNVRLAAKLTGYKIDIKGPGGSLTESEKKRLEKQKKEEDGKVEENKEVSEE
ncbi:transcription termination/antitermination protein NusA [Candidatus Beckwithbacteria bacterium]|nr:transcription termination/antitermination protein NusA [Candidatus Beckwithbacteria bacterium]